MPRVITFDQPGGPEVLQIFERALPEPSAGEVRIRMEAFGVNRLDLMVRAGFSLRPITLPGARLGLEGTGVIDAIGPDVSGWSRGDAVLIAAVPDADVNGTYAEYLTVPAVRVLLRPRGLEPPAAAALWVAHSTAYGALVEKSGMRPGDRVLITAASSGVGLAAIQVANQLGAVPLAVTRRAAARGALLEAGAAAVIATDEQELVPAVHELTDGGGADIIIDSVMGPGLAELAGTARFGGTLVAVGWLDPRPPVFPGPGALTIHRYMSFEHTLDPVVVRRIHAFLAAGVRSGVIAPIIDRVFAFDEIADAHRHVEAGPLFGKVVVTV